MKKLCLSLPLGEQFEMLKALKIPVECCLTSNVLSKTVATYDDHHFKELFNIKHPVVISVRFKKQNSEEILHD